QEAFMTLEQEQQVKTRTAEQNARIAAFEAERRREAEQTRILAERQIQETEIEREQAVRSRKVEAEREVRIKEIEQQQVTEIANQTKSIAIAAKSEQQSQAEARANLALAEAVSAQQNVETTRQTAEADRAKQVALIAAAQDAETKAVELTVRAKAEKEAAEMQALPAVIEKSVEPMKSIDGIKIIQVDGLNSGSAAGDANTGNVEGGNLAEQALSAALSYRTQAPLIDSLLNEIGVSGGSLAALTSPLISTTPVAENVK
ncbi:flotillin domain-containing protein, partial [Shigella flexneri]